MRILLAGARGQVGRRVHRLLETLGHEVRAVRGVDLTAVQSSAGLATGCRVVVSCAGASVSMNSPERRSYLAVDPVLNTNLLEESLRAGAYRFVYLGVHTEEAYAHTRCIEAHEQFCRRLAQAPIGSTVVRPTGIFSAFEDLLPMARLGLLPLIGSGSARTNPIDPQDVAELIVGCLEDGPASLPCGGPEILTRRRINEIVATSVGRSRPFMPGMPEAIARLQSRAAGLWSARLGELFEFFSAVAVSDAIAPPLGLRKLEAYLLPVPARLSVQAN